MLSEGYLKNADDNTLFRLLNRPTIAEDGTVLYYRSRAKRRLAPGKRERGKRPRKITTPLREPMNMLISVRFYRWAKTEFRPQINKLLFVDKYFRDVRDITPMRIGMILSDALQYNPHRRLYHHNVWAFGHQLEVQYGTERQICSWLEPFLCEEGDLGRRGGHIESLQEAEEELNYIVQNTPNDDLQNIFHPARDLGDYWRSSDRQEVEE